MADNKCGMRESETGYMKGHQVGGNSNSGCRLGYQLKSRHLLGKVAEQLIDGHAMLQEGLPAEGVAVDDRR